MFSIVELRHIRLCLTKQLAAGRVELLKLDEDSDEYMEKANDLMVLDSIIADLAAAMLGCRCFTRRC